MLSDELISRRITWEDAQRFAGEAFEVAVDEEGHGAVPMRVQEVRLRSRDPHMVQFSVLFRGPADPVYPQKMYRFRHARLGDYAIFITPVARTAAATDYEACFSHAP